VTPVRQRREWRSPADHSPAGVGFASPSNDSISSSSQALAALPSKLSELDDSLAVSPAPASHSPFEPDLQAFVHMIEKWLGTSVAQE
jgi:hypothetical protein